MATPTFKAPPTWRGVFDILPGYLKTPSPADNDFATYVKRTTPTISKPAEWDSYNYWSNTPKFAVSLLKAMYGDAAKKENDWAFHYLPKIDRKYSWTDIWDNMYHGHVKGLIAFGMNGVAIGPNSQKNIEALKKADWLVVGEIYPDETSEFWKSPGITPEEMKNIKTTVYRLPARFRGERRIDDVTRHGGCNGRAPHFLRPGDASLDQDIVAQIFLKVRELYKKEGGKFPDPILNLTGHTPIPSIHRSPKWPRKSTAKRWPTWRIQDEAARSRPVSSCPATPGCAMMEPRPAAIGSIAAPGRRRAQLTRAAAPKIHPALESIRTGHGHGRRTVVCCTTAPHAIVSGKPWDPERKQVWWNEAAQIWVGNDVPDFKADSHPKDHMGPFIMNPEGVGRIFAPLAAFADGPFPEHYEPMESPIQNPFHPNQSTNPVAKKLTSSAG